MVFTDIHFQATFSDSFLPTVLSSPLQAAAKSICLGVTLSSVVSILFKHYSRHFVISKYGERCAAFLKAAELWTLGRTGSYTAGFAIEQFDETLEFHQVSLRKYYESL